MTATNFTVYALVAFATAVQNFSGKLYVRFVFIYLKASQW